MSSSIPDDFQISFLMMVAVILGVPEITKESISLFMFQKVDGPGRTFVFKTNTGIFIGIDNSGTGVVSRQPCWSTVTVTVIAVAFCPDKVTDRCSRIVDSRISRSSIVVAIKIRSLITPADRFWNSRRRFRHQMRSSTCREPN